MEKSGIRISRVFAIFHLGRRKEFWELLGLIGGRIHRTVKWQVGSVQRAEGDRAQRGQA